EGGGGGRGGGGCGDDGVAVGADCRGLHLLGVGAGVGRFEVDDVAEEHFSVVEFVAPDEDGLEGERAFAQSSDHCLAASLNAFGDGDFTFGERRSTELISRRYMRTGSSVRSVGPLAPDLAASLGL